MTKEMEKIDVENLKENFNFQQAVDMFLYSPRKPWLYMMLYLGKERALRMVEKKDIGNNIVVANWSDEYAIVIPSDYAALWAEYEMNCFCDAREDESLNDMLVYTAVALMLLPDEWYAENCLSTFDMIVARMCEKYGKSLSEYTQPKELTELVDRLLGANQGSLYNPYAGMCSYASAIRSNVKYHGQEVSGACFIGKLRCLISGKENFEIECGDESWDRWLGDFAQFDYIVSTPPFGLKLDEKVSRWRDASIDFLERSSRDAQKKSIGVYPASICYHTFPRSVIKDLIERDILDTVVLLPQNIFPQTAIQTVIIVVNKEKTHQGSVRLIDASECFTKDGRKNLLDLDTVSTLLDCDRDNRVKVVSNDEIADNEYDITPKLYAQSQKIVFPEGYEILEFRDVLEPVQMHHTDTEGYLVKFFQLSTDSLDCERAVEDFEYSTHIGGALKVEEPVILISTIREARPTCCQASPQKPFFISRSDIKAFRIKKGYEWIEPHYLCLELSKRIGNIFLGSFQSRLSINYLVKVKLAFPSRSFDEQKRLFEEASYQRKLAKVQELGLQEVIDKLKAEYIDVVRSRAHDMRKYLRELSSFADIMKNYIKPQSGIRPFSQDAMMEMMCYYENNLSELSKRVDALSREERFSEAEIFDIDKYFQQRVDAHNNNLYNYCLNYYSEVNNFCAEEQDSRLVNISRDDFNHVVENIIQNAEKHGFVELDRKDYKIDIFLSIDEQKDMFQIDFVNNGSLLPAGLTREMYGINGKKAGRTGGTGVGGHIVKSFVEHFDGDYDLFMDNNKVVIRVLLPIFRKEE